MTKDEYRKFFAYCMKFIKMYPFLKDLHISQATFSRFLNYPGQYDMFISVGKLDSLYEAIYNSCSMVCDLHDEKIA